jgi:Protein of unknown function (DUF3800)
MFLSENLWWTMHHSDDPNNEVLALECYLDESGTDDTCPKAVIAGILLDRPRFLRIEKEWSELLAEKKIDPPLHMNEFGEHGIFGSMSPEDRFSLFTRAVDIINTFKIWSVSATLSKQEFNTYFATAGQLPPQVASRVMYEFCLATLIHKIDSMVDEWKPKYNPKIAYLLDSGVPYPEVVIEVANKIEKAFGPPYNYETVTHGQDKKIPALQVADMVAWGVRRKVSNKTFLNGFEPIEDIFIKKHVASSFEGNLKWFELVGSQLVCVLPKTLPRV